MNRQIYRQIAVRQAYKWMDGLIYRQVDRQIDIQIDGMDIQKDRWIDRLINGQMDR